MVDEVELKLAVGHEGALRLKRSPLLQGLRPSRQVLQSTYYDTADFRLLRQGVALRVRRVGRRWIQTVKAEAQALGALTSRPEWEVRVASDRPDIEKLPKPARAYFPADLVAALKPCFSTRFERTTWLLNEAGNSLELALDRGEIRAGRARLPISEVELELRGGSTAFLFDIAEQLAETVPFELEPRSKAERGYLLAGALASGPVKAKGPVINAGDPAGQAWQAMLAAALAQLSANVPGLLSRDDPEYLHQARVAIRRLLAVSAMAKTLDLPTPHWRRGLRSLMLALAPTREWDVMVTELLPSLSVLTDAQRSELLARAGRAQAKARGQARTAMQSPDSTRLVLDIGRSLAGDARAKGKVRPWARSVLDQRLQRLQRLGKGFERLDAAGRHRVRIAAKKLRYVADAFAPLYGEPATAYVDCLAGLQDKLGAANDAVMARQLLPELKLRGAVGAALATAFERALQDQTEARMGGLADSWQAFSEKPPFWRKPAPRKKQKKR